MSEETASISADERSAVLARVPDGRLHAALESVIAVSGDALNSDQATQAVVDRLVADLELARARLHILISEEEGPDHTHLELVAAAGSHAALTREMPSVALDGSSEIARVGESGQPEFHGDVHGLGEEPEGGHQGLGRWRAGVTTQSSAVLPLAVRGRNFGVLALEWSAPRAFDEPEREDLMATAAAAALVVDSFLAEERLARAVSVSPQVSEAAEEAQPKVAAIAEPTAPVKLAVSVEPGGVAAAEPAEAPQASSAAPAVIAHTAAGHPSVEPAGPSRVALAAPLVEASAAGALVTAELEVIADGLVVPAGVPGGWASSPALAMHVGISAPASTTEEVFYGVAEARPGHVVMLLGLVTASRGGGPSRIAEMARQIVRASALQGESPARALGLLSGWLAGSSHGTAWVSALIADIDVRQRVATWSGAGSVAFVSRQVTGRLGVSAAKHAPLGSVAAPELADHNALLLTGDRIALACGDVGALAAVGPSLERVRTSLATDASPHALVEVLPTQSGAAGAVVVEVLG